MTTLTELSRLGDSPLGITLALFLITTTVLYAFWCAYHKSSPPPATDTASPPVLSPEIAPPELHVEALEQLAQLPQFYRLRDGTLIDWTTGAEVAPCECKELPFMHLKVSWSGGRCLGFRSRKALTHFMAVQGQCALRLNPPAVAVVPTSPTSSTNTGGF